MGRPSDQHRSARRPGRRERARVKRHSRGMVYPGPTGKNVPGDETAFAKLGRKKMRRHRRWFALTYLSVTPPNARVSTRQFGKSESLARGLDGLATGPRAALRKVPLEWPATGLENQGGTSDVSGVRPLYLPPRKVG